MSLVEFKNTTSRGEQPQIYASDRVATGIGESLVKERKVFVLGKASYKF
jgi:hypothetical protein